MKKCVYGIVLCLSLLLGVGVVAHDNKGEATKQVGYSFKLPESQEYVPHIKDYRKRFHRVTQLQKSALHWGMGIVVYINQAKKTYAKNFLTYQQEFEGLGEEDDEVVAPEYKNYSPGTIFVKEQYALGKEHYLNKQGIPSEPVSLAIMIKEQPGYDPEHGDWRYIQIAKDGTEMFNGKGDSGVVKSQCGDCHKNVANRDYIYHTFYTQVQGE